MTSSERLVIEELLRCSRSLFDRGYCCTTAGNVSVRVEGKVFVTPTNSFLGTVTAEEIATVDLTDNAIEDRQPSKETPFHLAIYRSQPEMAAVITIYLIQQGGWVNAKEGKKISTVFQQEANKVFGRSP